MSHIVYLTTTDVSGESGQNVYSKNIIKSLFLSDHKVTVVCPYPKKDIELVEDNIDKFSFLKQKTRQSVLWNLLVQKDIFYKLNSIHSNNKIDILLSTLKPASVLVPWIVKKNNLTYGLIVEGELDNEVGEFTNNLYKYVTSKNCARNLDSADSIFIAYKELEEWVMSRSNQQKNNIHHFPHGVPSEFVRHSVSQQTHNSGPLKIGYVGSFKKYHCLSELLHAVYLVQKNDLDVKINMIGTGPEYNKCIKLVDQLNISDSVEFHGYVEQNQIPDLVSAYDVMYGVITPDRSGSPMKVYEYLSLGKPAICLQSSEFKFIKLNDLGYLINEINEESISDAITYFANLEDKLLISYSEECKNYMENNHNTWENFTDQLLKLLVCD